MKQYLERCEGYGILLQPANPLFLYRRERKEEEKREKSDHVEMGRGEERKRKFRDKDEDYDILKYTKIGLEKADANATLLKNTT